jgi:D-3-phosphoglycerate dehydrogenase
VNNIPVERCSEKGVVVFNTPGANSNAVKELVLAMLLISARNVSDAIDWTRSIKGKTAETVEKNKARFAGEEIKGKRLAVIGLGAIGVLVANAAYHLGMKVAGYDPYLSVQNAHDLNPAVKIYESAAACLPAADYVSIHVPATDSTNGMFDYQLMETMKNKAVLLNFSRDSIVKTEDLKQVLAEKKLRLYVTDFPTDELIGIENTLLIPHLGASTKESEENCANMAVTQLMNYLEQGIIENSVNFPALNPGPKAGTRICVLNRNIPSMLGKLTGVLADMNANISNMTNKSKGDNAYTVIDLDDANADSERIKKAFDFEGIISVRVI